MPEGDTLHRLALRLERVLAGRLVRSFCAHDVLGATAKTLEGRAVTRVEARGKNLLVYFDDGRVLHVHLRMLGRIRIEAPNVRAAGAAPALELAVDGAVVVGTQIPIVRLLRPAQLARAPDLVSLGPDLLGKTFDLEEAIARLRALGGRAIGDALLVQSAVAGIGNVYKSEILFLEQVSPEEQVAELDVATLRRLLLRAQSLLAQNLGRGPRRTRSALAGPRLWVYGRRGKACLRCGAAVAMIRQGPAPGRSTYHCPQCQPRPTKDR
jgi:endonuclease VIII